MRVEVQEKPTGTLSFGAGYSRILVLEYFEYSEKNFWVEQSLSFAIRTGTEDQLYEFSFYEPMFLRNDLGLGLSLSLKDTNQQNAAYDTKNTKFQPFVMYPLGKTSKLKLNYSITQTELSNPANVGAIITNEVNQGKKLIPA